jgi:hypothetical protein
MPRAFPISEREKFMQRARDEHATIRVMRWGSVYPVTSGGAVQMAPELMIRYWIEFDDPVEGDCAWYYEEGFPADKRGDVDLTSSLWKKLDDEHVPHVLVKQN